GPGAPLAVRYSLGVGKIVPSCSNLLPWLLCGLLRMSCDHAVTNRVQAMANNERCFMYLYFFIAVHIVIGKYFMTAFTRSTVIKYFIQKTVFVLLPFLQQRPARRLRLRKYKFFEEF